ncbi:hypothetical protein ACFSHP_10605 [Novosphingobium panipatense]
MGEGDSRYLDFGFSQAIAFRQQFVPIAVDVEEAARQESQGDDVYREDRTVSDTRQGMASRTGSLPAEKGRSSIGK